jgi:hypothetical protein
MGRTPEILATGIIGVAQRAVASEASERSYGSGKKQSEPSKLEPAVGAFAIAAWNLLPLFSARITRLIP